MMKNNFLIYLSLLFSSLLIFVAVSASGVSAQEGRKFDITFPITELGGCKNEASCKAYCDRSENGERCLNFAEQKGLMSASEVAKARAVFAQGSGPGGCKTQAECENYCDNLDNMNECLVFAEKNGLMTDDELGEAKKVQSARARGVKMPACNSKDSCEAYCTEANHMEECIVFAEEAGLMEGEEIVEAKKMLSAIKNGATPPPCRGKKDCEKYCSIESNFNVCLDFAIASGMIDSKEAEMARKTKGKGPGNCRGRDECKNYCEVEENMPVCLEFAYSNGMMTEKEYEIAKKTGGRGPGGCKSESECKAFCENPNNQETCFLFGKETGILNDDEVNKTEEGNRNFRESMQNMPPEVYKCLEEKFGGEILEKLRSGRGMPTREMAEKMPECFRKFMPEVPVGDDHGRQEEFGDDSNERNDSPSMMRGPGGCSSREECNKYCQSNPTACGFRGESQSEYPSKMPIPGMMPTEGYFENRSDGQYAPRDGQQLPTDGNYRDYPTAPYQIETRPTEQAPTEPPTSMGIDKFLANVLNAFRSMVKR